MRHARRLIGWRLRSDTDTGRLRDHVARLALLICVSLFLVSRYL